MIAFVCRCGARPAQEVVSGHIVENTTTINTDEHGNTIFGGGHIVCNVCKQVGKIVCDGTDRWCQDNGTATWCNWHQQNIVKFTR